MVKDSVWRWVKVTNPNDKCARYVKIGESLRLKYDQIIWIDGSVEIKTDLNDFVKKCHRAPFTVVGHPVRTCIYKEAIECMNRLKDDPNIKHKHEIKAQSTDKKTDLGFGDPMQAQQETDELRAVRESVENGDFVLVDRIHDRMNRKLLMFVDDVEDPIMEEDHPFIKMSYEQRMDMFGQLMFEEDGITPLLDLNSGQPAPGWLVEGGFPFIPVKFDLHSTSYYPEPHLEYVKDIQSGIVESLSRQANLLKRTSRQGLVAESEVLNSPNLLDNLRRGVDGEWHRVQDVNNFKELVYGQVPPDQYRLEDRLRSYEEEITRVTDLVESGATPRTATEASLMANQLSVNREWMESAVSGVYERIVRNCFQIFGDPRYIPENFVVNVAPNGQGILNRAMRNADFLWNYRITVVTGSTQPLFEQIQQDKFLEFYDRASQRPSFDQTELDKMLASSAEVDVDKVILQSENPEAVRAAQMENETMVSQMQDPGVVEGQDDQAHLTTHQEYRNHPRYQQLVMQSQQVNFQGGPMNPQAAQQVQYVDQLVAQHMQAHEQQLAAQAEGPAASPGPRGESTDSIQSTVRGNAQRVANTLQGDAKEALDGA